jgi:hypothetical protein
MLEDILSDQTNRPDTGQRQTIQVLSDTPGANSGDDSLDFLPYAQALAFLIDRKDTATPLIIAISAPWGAGKTTLARLVQRELQAPGDWDEPHIICSFNAWNHDDAPHLGAAFAADVAQSANRHRALWRRVFQPLPAAMLTPEQSWRRKLYVILLALLITGFLMFGPDIGKIATAAAQPTGEHWTAAEHAAHGFGLTVILALAVLAFIYPRVLTGAQAVARFVKNPEAEAAHGSIASVRTQLGNLIRQATGGHRRFVIFIDDLERCRPPRAVEVCEVASQLLDHHDTVTVLVADMDAIAMSAAIKYRALELPDQGAAPGEPLKGVYMRYGRGYLQKLVQIQFDLPPATPGQLRTMLSGARIPDASKPPYIASREAGDGILPALQSSVNWRTARRNAYAISIGIGSLVISAYVAYIATKLTAKGSHATSAWYGSVGLVAFATLGLAAVSALTAILQSLRRRQRRALRRMIDVTIGEQSAGTTVEQAIESFSSATPKVSPVSVEKRYFRAVMDPEIVRRADEQVFKFLPKRPRAAKRLLNQVRLMISIAIARGLFVLPGDDAGSEQQKTLADRVGKWLILRERWPDLAMGADRDAGLIRILEDAAAHDNADSLRIELDTLRMPEVDDLNDLRKLLREEPKFGDLSSLMLLSGASPAAAGMYESGSE